MLFYTEQIDAIYAELRSGADGITKTEAARRLKAYGRNSLSLYRVPLWRKLIEPFTDVFTIVLFVAAILSVFHHAYLDAILVGIIIVINTVIYYVQRFSTERILRSLEKKGQQHVSVRRGGEFMSIDDEELVPGDIIQLAEGDKIPADIRLIHADNVRVSEAMLTGESVPISKSAHVLETKKEVYEQSNMLFQGAFIVSGQATGIVVATGNGTEFGKIAALTSQTADEARSPVQEKIDKLITRIIIIIAIVSVVAFALSLLRGAGFTESLQFVLALAVSAVPEGLPIAISVILVLGMRRMAAKKALVRNMRAIETIGVITTIATDKTGTLTENKLSVQEIWQPEGSKVPMANAIERAVNYQGGQTHDPLDVAMVEYIYKERSTIKGSIIGRLPFDQAAAMSGNIWEINKKYELFVKGAPEQVLKRSDLTKKEHDTASAALLQLTGKGYRVLALAATPLKKPIQKFQELPAKETFVFIGFIAVADTLRTTARKAITIAQNAGVTVRMITGDHFETAYHIGKELGLVTSREQVFDSTKVESMRSSELRRHVRDARVFSRVTPENKFKILKILKVKEVTAMTGDGVNDVPALASSHVGIAMGSGSQIAKDASDMILLNNNFASIIHAMKEGRIIFANVRRMLFYLLSTNTGEIITILGALIIGMPAPLVPVQILWVNLVTDSAMVIPLGLEPGEKDTMKRKPINPKSPILDKTIITRMILVALLMGGITLGFYIYYSNLYGEAYGRTIAFCALVVIQWANAFNARSTYESVFTRLKVMNKSFYVGLAIAVFVQLLALFGPLQDILHITPVDTLDLVTTSLIAFTAMIALVEIHKWVARHNFEKATK